MYEYEYVFSIKERQQFFVNKFKRIFNIILFSFFFAIFCCFNKIRKKNKKLKREKTHFCYEIMAPGINK